MEIEFIVTGKQQRITREYNNLGARFDRVVDLREREVCEDVRQGERLESTLRLIGKVEEWILVNAIVDKIQGPKEYSEENKEFRNMCREELERRLLQLCLLKSVNHTDGI